MAAEPLMWDLFCGAGGAATGYALAGFRIIGVDIRPQPGYPFAFVQGDALEALRGLAAGEYGGLGRPDAVHVSPACQRFARVTGWRGSRENHPDLLTPALSLLPGCGVPWIVENVPEACPPMRADYRLCGTQFGLAVKRHRVFMRGGWDGFELIQPCGCWRNRSLHHFEHKAERAFTDAMGCSWMTVREGRQAVPPAFTRYIGGHLMAWLRREGMAA